MSKAQDILSKIKDDDKLPTLPSIASKLTALIADIETNSEDIANVLQSDLAIASRILKLSRSAALGSVNRDISLINAVSMLGFEKVQNIVMTLSVIKEFSSEKGLNYGLFWRHSISVAIVSQLIEKYASNLTGFSADSYSAGLFHDTGILLLSQYVHEEYAGIIKQASETDNKLVQLEFAALGTTHAEVGSLLLKRWNFSDQVVLAALKHEDVEGDSDEPEIAKIVRIANFICVSNGIGNGVSYTVPNCREEDWEAIGLPLDVTSIIVEQLNQKNADVAKLLFDE